MLLPIPVGIFRLFRYSLCVMQCFLMRFQYLDGVFAGSESKESKEMKSLTVKERNKQTKAYHRRLMRKYNSK